MIPFKLKLSIKLTMKILTEEYKQAVKRAIKDNHALGLPVYQCKDDHIVAIYPDSREIKLQKIYKTLDI